MSEKRVVDEFRKAKKLVQSSHDDMQKEIDNILEGIREKAYKDLQKTLVSSSES